MSSGLKLFSEALKAKVGKGWNVINSRGYIRLQVGRKPNVISSLLITNGQNLMIGWTLKSYRFSS